jgi:Fibronectin type III domain
MGKQGRKFWSLSGLFALLLGLLPAVSAGATTPVSAPRNVSASVTFNILNVSWSAPTYTNTGITVYWLQDSLDGATWNTVSNSISGSSTSYQITNLLSNTNYYVRVAAYGGSWGAWGYPWTKVFSLTTSTAANMRRNSSGLWNYDSGYGLGGSDAYASLPTNYIRVMYSETMTISSLTTTATQDMPTWNSNVVPCYASGASPLCDNSKSSLSSAVGNLAFPDLVSHKNTIQTNVSDLNSFNSQTASLTESGVNGRLEIWPYNYAPGNSGLSPAGNACNYDYDDVDAYTSNYGSFQVHDTSNSQTLFAWNNHDYSASAAEVAFGNDPHASATCASQTEGVDWTFCSQHSDCPLPSSFAVSVSVDLPIQTGVAATLSESISSGPYQFGKVVTLTASIPNSPGKVTFYYNGKPIFHCVNLATASSTATCNWRVSYHGYAALTAIYTANNGVSASNLTSALYAALGARTSAHG